MIERLENTCGRLADRYDRSSRRRRIWLLIAAYAALFIVAAALAYSPLIVGHKSFIETGDGRSQHFPFMLYLGRSVRRVVLSLLKGDFSFPLFGLSLGLGNDVIGVLNPHGYTDPLMLIAALVPTRYGEYTYTFLIFLRLYLAGLSFLYLCHTFRCKDWAALIGSVIYCFCGYAMYSSTFHPYFVTPMITLPLLVVGMEKVLRRERPYVLIFATFYAGLCSFYHFYMMTILVGIYALIRLFDIYRTKKLKELVLAAWRAAWGYGIGLGMAAVVFLPAATNFLQSARSGERNRIPILYSAREILNRIFNMIRVQMAAPVVLGLAAISLFAVVLLLCSRRKRTLKALTVVLFAVFLTPIGNTFMNGFQYPSERWVFGLALLLSFVVVYELPELMDMSVKQRTICVCLACIYMAAVLFVKQIRTLPYILSAVAFLVMTLLVLIGDVAPRPAGRQAGKRTGQTLRIAVCTVLVVANVAANGIYYLAADQGNYTTNHAVSGTEISRVTGETRQLERELEPYLLDDPSGRGDGSIFFRNASSVWMIPGMLEYNSLMLGDVSDFWQAIEHTEWCPFYFSISDTSQQTIAGTLLSEKYQVEPANRAAYAAYGYRLIEETAKGNLIFENEYALPWGYTYDNAISYEQLDGLNGIQKQQAMLQAIALEEGASWEDGCEIEFAETELPYEVECEGCSWEDGQLKVDGAGSKIILHFDMPESVEGYVRLIGYDTVNKEITIQMDCGPISRTLKATMKSSSHYIGREDYLFNLSYSDQKRDSLSITFPDKGTFRLEDIELYALPMDDYPEQVEALRAEPMENIHWGTDSLTGTVDLSKDKILCVSVPYSKGWTATVDGEKAEILKGNYMFMCLPLTAGHHDIEFHYCSPGIRLGAVMTVCCTGIVAYMLLWDRKKRRAAVNGSSEEK